MQKTLASIPKLSQPEKLACLAVYALYQELQCYPKPGLVSFIDQGSHKDMNALMLMRSAITLQSYFYKIAHASLHHASFSQLQLIGIEAEQAMLKVTRGCNTHRGALFTLGLLIASMAHVNQWKDIPAYISDHWGGIILKKCGKNKSHGEKYRKHDGIRTILEEAALGYPSIFQLGLSALDIARKKTTEKNLIHLFTFFSLLAEVDDTTLLHRGGLSALRFAKRASIHLLTHYNLIDPAFILEAKRLHQYFIQHRWTSGGCADLLAAILFIDTFRPSSPE